MSMQAWQILSALTLMQSLEWLAAVLTIAGAWLLASQGKNASWGFVFFLAANAVWILFSCVNGLYGLLFQQLVLTVTSLLGIWNGLVVPALASPSFKFSKD